MHSLCILFSSGLSFTTIARKSLVSAFAAIVMLCGVSAPVGATEHVITIYFSGTGTPENAWDGPNSAWGTRSLIPTLYNHDAGLDPGEDVGPGDRQHKIHSAGVGAPPDCSTEGDLLDLLSPSNLQKADPHSAKDITPDCRPWKNTVDEAMLHLDDVLITKLDFWSDTTILNVVGHSRGAIAVMWFLRDLANRDELWFPSHLITRVNAVVLDPVPGIDMTKNDYSPVTYVPDGESSALMGWDAFRINEGVSNLVVVYAWDERSALFEPVVPYYNQEKTQAFMYSVRGSHQTMVGNKQVGGHDPRWYIGLKWLDDNDLIDNDLLNVSNTVGLTVMRLLHGLQWGSVEFNDTGDEQNDPAYEILGEYCPNGSKDEFWLDDDGCRSDFISHVNNINDASLYPEIWRDVWWVPDDWLHWERMKGLGYVPFDDLSAWDDGACKAKINLHAQYRQRCVMRMSEDGKHHDNLHAQRSLEKDDAGYIPLIGIDITAEEAWNRILALAEGDSDGDGVTDNLDVCSGTESGREVDEKGCADEQVDFDGDTICDPGVESAGVSACTGSDNCPFTPNKWQQDSDSDGEGDACDPVAHAIDPGLDEPRRYIEECTSPNGALVRFDGSHSYDPEDDPLTFAWEIGAYPFESEQIKPLMFLSIGEHHVELTVEDPDGNTDSDTTKAIVQDTTAPDLHCPEDMVIECSGFDGAPATYTPTATDTCDATLAPGCDPASGTVFELGIHSPICSVTDDHGNRSDCTFDITVQDTTPPVITGITKPIFKWPPNHKYQTFVIEDFVHKVEDICWPPDTIHLEIVEVTSSEPDDGKGDGHTTDDIVIADGGKSVDLRIERSGKKKSRIYTVFIRATDNSGKHSTESFEVIVGKK